MSQKDTFPVLISAHEFISIDAFPKREQASKAAANRVSECSITCLPLAEKLRPLYDKVTEGLRWEGASGDHLIQPPSHLAGYT